MNFIFGSLWVALADKYHLARNDISLAVPHDGSAGPENKANLGQIRNLNQMGHFIIAQQLVVNVVSGSLVSTRHKYCTKADSVTCD